MQDNEANVTTTTATENTAAPAPANSQSSAPASENSQPISFDYDKLASIVSGKQAAAEETVLKGYFKQQGVTGEEASQAIAAFKAEKAKNTPDPTALQAQINQANAAALRAVMDNHALLLSSEVGVDMKAMPYVMKMADLSEVASDGTVDDEKLKEAINKVLEDIPQLKSHSDEESAAGFKIGANTGAAEQAASNDKLRAAFGLK